MPQSTNSQLINSSCQMLCGYVNPTSSLQIIRIVNIPNWRFERVVFPGERFLFEAPPNAELEVHTSYFGQAVLVKKMPGDRLKVEQRQPNCQH
jgi:hypothetical protein